MPVAWKAACILFGKHHGQRRWLEGSPGTPEQTTHWVDLHHIVHMLTSVPRGSAMYAMESTVLWCSKLKQEEWGQCWL